MSALSALFLVWAAIYAYAGAYYATLWVELRRRESAYFPFTCSCFAVVVHCIGSAILLDADTMEAATLALRIEYCSGFALAGFFVDFVSRITQRLTQRVVWLGYSASAIGMIIAASGRAFDPAHPAVALTRWSESDRIEPLLRLEGGIAILLGLAATTIGASALLAAMRGGDPDARLIAWGAMPSAVCAMHDHVGRLLGARPWPLFEIFGVVMVICVSNVLLRRFVEAAQQLNERTSEVARAYEELRRTQEELVRKEQLAAVGELSAVIAHEVRNPLAILKNAVATMRRPTLGPSDRGVLLGILDEETDRLNRLVRDLLAYARPVTPRGGAVEVEPLIERALEQAKGGRDASRIEVVLECEGPLAVRGDPELLRHALVNVIDNALQAMSANGKLTIRTTEARLDDKRACAIAVVDTGEGMDTLVRAKALDPFFTTRPAGTGLGLAIVDRVVRNHGGRIAIDSAPGQGTNVTLLLEAATGAETKR